MKELMVERVAVWVAGIKDEPGGLAQVIGALAEAGADLDFLIARRAPDKPGEGVVFLTPLRSDAEVQAASPWGFVATRSVHSVRIEGVNEAGAAAKVAAALAAAGLNLHGLSAAVIDTRFVAYIGLDSAEDADRAVAVLQSL
ncbi:MAG: amino acid-binding protein [Armatimonadetes bacterium]|nr:amino acid-binding protein [Armatimonadota bacterium]